MNAGGAANAWPYYQINGNEQLIQGPHAKNSSNSVVGPHNNPTKDSKKQSRQW